MNELKLIRLYFYLCECNDTVLALHHQRFSNNSSPSNEKLTDVELLTIYFYCRRFEKKHSKSDVYDFAKRYLYSWFPNLPAYANFNSRLNNLCSAMPYLIEWMLNDLENLEGESLHHFIRYSLTSDKFGSPKSCSANVGFNFPTRLWKIFPRITSAVMGKPS